MRDPITDAAQDPSCLLCLTPDRGGSWWSRLRPAMPRNFADNPRVWTNAKTALDVTDQSHDFTFEIEFKCVKTNAVYIFASDASRDFIRVFMSAGQVIVNSALMSTSPGGSTQFSAGSDPTNRHTLTVKMIGNTITALIDGEIVYTRENLVRNAIEISAPRSNAGYVYKISITDDTTGETVWQAAYSDLYETSNPWPSPVPRNFAEEPMTWRDEKTTAPSIGEDDCEFFIRYRLDGYPEGSAISQIFYHNSQNGSINIAFAGDGTGGNYSVIRLTDVGAFVIPLDRIRQLGEHTIRIQRVGLFVTVEFDGEVVATSSAGTKKIAVYSTTAPVSDFDGVIFETYWKSLTTGRTVWRYPSEAERVRLITKTNVRTDRGAFEAADENTIAGVDTQLDLRGNATSKTFIVRAFCPAHDPASGKLYIHPFFGQGATHQNASLYTFQFSLWEDRRSGGTTQLFLTISTGTDTPGANVTGAEIYLDQWHTYAMVIDYNGGNCYIRAFVDGVLLRERTVSGTTVWNTPTATTTQETTVGIRRDPNLSYYAGSLTRISTALIFDRALSAAEIAALTPKQA